MGKVAIVFSGQGAQYPGMGKELYDNFAAAKDIFDRAEVLYPGIKELCFNGTKEALMRTENTQPCVFVVDMAAAAAICECGIKPDMAAGFSLGEIAAVAFSGMLEFEEAFKLVLYRAKIMQICAEKNPGEMFAVLKLKAEDVKALASEFKRAYPVNFNCPGQTVVAIAKDEAEAFTAKVAEVKGRTVKLNVNGAFHSPFMEEAAKDLKEYIGGLKFNAPKIPVYSNITAEPYDDNTIELLSMQVKSPVLWEQSVRNMKRDGCKYTIEAGPGKTLVGLIKKTDPDIAAYNAENKESVEKAIEGIGEKQC